MSFRTLLIAVLTALSAATVPVRAASPTVATCFVDWSDAAPVVEREQLTTARNVHDLARRHVLGELVRITLCREADVYTYRLVVRDGQGRVLNVTVDARRPFDR